jgi:hypothetical protein
MHSLQLHIFGLCGDEHGIVRVSVFPHRDEILIRGVGHLRELGRPLLGADVRHRQAASQIGEANGATCREVLTLDKALDLYL